LRIRARGKEQSNRVQWAGKWLGGVVRGWECAGLAILISLREGTFSQEGEVRKTKKGYQKV